MDCHFYQSTLIAAAWLWVCILFKAMHKVVKILQLNLK